MKTIVAGLAGTLMVLAAGAGAAPSVGAAGSFQLESTIAFTSTRDHIPALTPNPLLGGEIYLANPDMTNPRRLTDNDSFDGFAALSPDGTKIVFDSTRFTDCPTCETPGFINRSDLFLMNTDGTEQTFLTHGSSATWSPDSKNIAFAASASGSGTPIRTDPGSATSDSDIFVVNVDDLLSGVEQPRNLTNSPGIIDEDADWSPDGKTIAYTRHPDTDNPVVSDTAEIYLVAADGTGPPKRLTFNDSEERGPSWSPDGTRIVYGCRLGAPRPGTVAPRTFEICVIDVATGDVQRLTDNSVVDLTPTWSPDGQQILFHRGPPPQQLFVMNATLNADGTLPTATQLTSSDKGWNNLANWGELRVKDPQPTPEGTGTRP